MSKRSHNHDDSRPPKRPKYDQPNPPQAPEEIHFARQLQELLSFRQDGIHQLRAGIASFKAFLESILYHKNEDDRGRELSILREYLESQKPDDPSDTERPFLGQLWQAWSFASTNNNEHLVSSISAIFTLLLRTLSSLLDFRDFGILLGRTVLQSQHLRLVKKSLDAPKHKDFLISPCLRLLIEVTGFDGGVLAKDVYKRREQTFDFVTLRRNLGMVKSDRSEEEAKRRPAVRTITIRYILAHLKYLHEGGKTDLLKNRPLCTSLFHFLQDDPADVVVELLSTIEQYVLKDDQLPRSAKAAVLLQHNLERVTEIATRSGEDHSAANAAFSWLKAVCIKPSYGILRTSGWYPPGTTTLDRAGRDDRSIDLGLNSIDFYDSGEKPNIRNSIILSYIQTLRPHSSLQERELVIACFTAAPELVGAYTAEKHMQLDPKLSNTWIGYASFLFEVVQLPVPEHFGHEESWAQLPPQTDIMLESILPRPLTQKVLTRCLNQSSDLVTFFAIRILVMALEKLCKVCSQLEIGGEAAGKQTALWHEAADRLKAGFIERCPLIKDIITTFRKLPDDDGHALQQEAITRLLRLYYDTLPLEALEQYFDISTALTAALVQNQAHEDESEIKQLRALRLGHLLQIAKQSAGMKWFSKQGALEVSPITTLLQIHSKDCQNREIRELVRHVLMENSIMQSPMDCDTLIALLDQEPERNEIVLPFLDDCLARLTRQPVKYLDLFDGLVQRAGMADGRNRAQDPPLLVAVFLEQAPFVAKREDRENAELVYFMEAYVELIRFTADTDGEDERFDMLDAMEREVTGEGMFHGGKHFDDPESSFFDLVRLPDVPTPVEIEKSQLPFNGEAAITFTPPPSESENHPELLKWAQKDLGLAFEDGDIAALILCLSSQYPEVRTQALTQLRKLEDRVLNSNIDDRDPIYVLLGEVIETYEHHRESTHEPLPYLTTSFAAHALSVQMQPIHYMYPKINKFLNKGPSWRVNRLPTYWLENTVLSEPEEDDAYWKEVQWVLGWIVDGLRGPADLEILRRGAVFEKVMSLYSSPGAEKVKTSVLEILWRATWIEGGSMTLVTRAGVLTWLKMVAGEKDGGGAVAALRKRVLETCDQAKVEQWSGTAVESI